MKRLIWVILALVVLSGCTNVYSSKVSETKNLMDTYVEITVLDQDELKAEKAITDAFEEMIKVENLVSIYKEDTQLYSLNEKGFLIDADEEIIYLLKESNKYSELSNGSFDITVQPILDLYTKSFEVNKRAPTEKEINDTLSLIDYKGIVIKSNDIRIRKNMKITLGGIAKGYAIDKAIEALEKNGIKHALVNAGGDMRAIGKKGMEDWSIALRNPRDKEDYITIIKLDNNSVATSGDYERYFDSEKKFHHIVDPRTGYSATDLISVTIIAGTALEADALATSVFVLGPEKGLELVESLDNVEGLLITKDREIIKSSGFKY